jgi:hypothetical protein
MKKRCFPSSLALLLLAAWCSSGISQEPLPWNDKSEGAYCGRNPFNRDTALPMPIALTDWHNDPCQWERAGCPQNLRPHARPSYGPYFYGWWVGGGTAVGGDMPCLNEGTWGWDYEGVVPKRVWLLWSHGRRYQGGTGAYKTDGPKLHLHE